MRTQASWGLMVVAAWALSGGCHGLKNTVGAPEIVWESTHDAPLARAKAAHKPVILDFTAQWCTACKELERRTYTDPAVRRAAGRFVAVKIDATALDEPVKALFDRYTIVGLPAVVFIDSQGRVLESPRLSGFVQPPRFLEVLAQVQ